MIPAFFAYGTVYCFLNHIMHETHHRTPFKSTWLNNLVHWICGFCHGAEPIFDRWGHTQHHTYTYFYDVDPEVVTKRPANLWVLLGSYFGIGIIKPIPIIKHALGIKTKQAIEYAPESEWNKMVWSARCWLLGYGLIIASCFVFHTILPLVFTLFARFYGAFIPTALNNTQHVGLAANVYDHRLCTRNVKVNPVLSFFYMNMQYHIEHHMFPGVPFHALSKLHEKVKSQLPRVYTSTFDAYRELIPTVLRQQKDPSYYVTPVLPETEKPETAGLDSEKTQNAVQEKIPALDDIKWIPAIGADELDMDDVIGFEHEGKRYAIYRLSDGYYASEGKCTHAGAILANGLVVDENIECPAHQGRFDIRTGKATCSPACKDLKTFPTKVENGQVHIGLHKSSE
jgi:MocE subfamily Rieske [2Fe-2S] domain protein